MQEGSLLCESCAAGKAMVKSSQGKERERKRQKVKRRRQRIAERLKMVEEQLQDTLPISGQKESDFSTTARGTYIPTGV